MNDPRHAEAKRLLAEGVPETMNPEVLHRDDAGKALLVGPNCPDCKRRCVAMYRCVDCGHLIAVVGEFRWYWQGSGHWHKADDPDWHAALTKHLGDEHGGHGAFVPVDTEEE